MQLPEILENQIQQKLQNKQRKEMKEKANRLSSRYMTEARRGQTFLSSEDDVLAYAAIRMPSTYSAVVTVLKQIEGKVEKVDSVIDVGAGTGAAVWALHDIFQLKDITCIEREKEMSRIGKEWMEKDEVLKRANWISCDVIKDEIPKKADFIISSYMMNEVPQEQRMSVVKKMLEATNDILVIIEPGTPAGFDTIRKIQKEAIKEGHTILAPCTAQIECPLPEEDWCHTTVRVSRTKWHKYLKEGEAPYEDEKFSYLVLSKKSKTNNLEYARILRHPMIEKGKVTMKLCYQGTIIERLTINCQ